MAIIGERDAQLLREQFAKNLVAGLTLDLFVRPKSILWIPGRQECETCEDTQKLLEELTSLSDKLTLRTHDIDKEAEAARAMDITRVPALVISGNAKGKLRFFGIPSGYELAALVQTLIDVSRGDARLATQTAEALQNLSKPIHVQVFVTPTCAFCPAMAQLAHRFAVQSEQVTADVIEVTEFPELGQQYHVQGVPKTVVNDRVELIGAQPEPRLLEAIQQAVGTGSAQKSDGSESPSAAVGADVASQS
jgi:glutaredoxin-like protein